MSPPSKKQVLVEISVAPDENLRCCTNYQFDFFLQLWIENKMLRQSYLGTLHSSTIDKTTAARDRLDPAGVAWRRELVIPKLNERSSPAQDVFRAVYQTTGQVRPALKDIDGIQGQRIHYIANFNVTFLFRGTGLAQQLLEAFHTLLPQVPNGAAYSGPILLRPTGNQKTTEGMTRPGQPPRPRKEIELALIESWKLSKYEVVVQEDEDCTHPTIMARQVPVGEESDNIIVLSKSTSDAGNPVWRACMGFY